MKNRSSNWTHYKKKTASSFSKVKNQTENNKNISLINTEYFKNVHSFPFGDYKIENWVEWSEVLHYLKVTVKLALTLHKQNLEQEIIKTYLSLFIIGCLKKRNSHPPVHIRKKWGQCSVIQNVEILGENCQKKFGRSALRLFLSCKVKQKNIQFSKTQYQMPWSVERLFQLIKTRQI